MLGAFLALLLAVPLANTALLSGSAAAAQVLAPAAAVDQTAFASAPAEALTVPGVSVAPAGASPVVWNPDYGIPGPLETSALSPTDGSTGNPTSPTLSVSTTGALPGEVLKYAFVVCTGFVAGSIDINGSPRCTGSSIAASSGWISQPTWKVPGILAANATYTWTGQGVNATAGSGTSDSNWFTTGGAPSAYPVDRNAIIKRISPASKSFLTTLTPLLQTQMKIAQPGLQYFTQYKVYACQDGYCAGTQVVADSGQFPVGNYTVPAGALYWGGVYSWSVNLYYPFSLGGTLATFQYQPPGTFATSVPLPAGQQTGAQAQSPEEAGVRLSDRHFEYSATDAAVTTPGGPLSVTRSYSSTDTDVGAFGRGWNSLLDMKVSATSIGVMVQLQDGHQFTFGRNPNGSYSGSAGSSGMTLASCASPCTGGDLEFTDRDGTKYVFSFGKLAKFTDVMGFARTVAYDSAGLASTVTDVTSGRSLTLTWASSKVQSVTVNPSPAGTPSQWTYRYSGQLLSAACPPESTTACTTYKHQFSTSGYLTTVTNTVGTVVASIAYSVGKVTASTVEGATSTFISASEVGGGQTVTVSNPLGAQLTYRLDKYGRPIERTTSVGASDRWAYNYLGNLITYLNGAGNRIEFMYNADNLLSRRLFNAGTGSVADNIGELYYYGTGTSDRGKLVSIKNGGADPSNQILGLSYDSAGRISSLTEGVGSEQTTRSVSYTNGTQFVCGSSTVKAPPGLPLTLTDEAGNKTTRSYTVKGDLCQVQDAENGRTTYTYDSLGRVLSIAQRVASTTAQNVATYTYGANGMVASYTEAPTTDLLSGKTRQSQFTYAYDAAYNQTGITQTDLNSGAARTTTYGYDPFGRLTGVTNPDNSTVSYGYDVAGNISSAVDPSGATTAYQYDPLGRLTATIAKAYTTPTGAVTPHDITVETRTYDAAGRINTVTDRAGHATKYTYTIDDHVASVVSVAQPLANGSTKDVIQKAYTYDKRGNPVKTVLNDGSLTLDSTYNSKGQLTKVTSSVAQPGSWSVQRTATYAYDARGLLTQQTLGSGNSSKTITTTYDANGLVSATTTSTTPTSADKATTWYQRNNRGDVIAVTDPRGSAAGDAAWTTTYQLDRLGNVQQINAPPPTSGASRPATKFGYDAFGRTVLTIGPDGQRTEATYDAMDRLVTQTNPYFTPAPVGGAPKTSYTYNPTGTVATITQPGGQQTILGYDTLGQTVTQTLPPRATGTSPRVSSVTYDDAGNPVTSTDAAGSVTNRTYDTLGRLLTEVQTLNLGAQTKTASTTRSYDIAGNLISIKDPTGATATATYNAIGEPLKVTDPDGGVTAFARDSLGQISTIIDPVGNKEVTQRDARGNITAVSQYDATAALIGTDAATYDLAGNQLTATDPRGNTQTFTYDALNRLTTAKTADGATVGLGYDNSGNATSFTDQRGNTTTATYAADGQITTQTEPSTSAYPNPSDRTTSWTYTPDGLPATITNPGGGTITNTYDAAGNLTTQQAATGASTAVNSFGYNDLGDLTSFSTPTGTQNQTYNQAGWLLKSQGPAGNSTYTYDTAGHQLSVKDQAGTASSTWTAGGRLASYTPATGSAISYTYDAAGKPTKETWGSTLTRAYTYVDGNLLGTDTTTTSSGTLLSASSYTYDDAGNLTQKAVTPTGTAGAGTTSYSYDNRNRLTSWKDPANTDHPITWDAADNLTSTDGATRVYDERNRLTKIADSPTLPYDAAGNSTAGYTWDPFGNLSVDNGHSYTYDALGRIASDDSTTFTYRGLETDASGIGSTSLSRNPDGQLTTSGSSYTITDPRGDITGIVAADGTATTRSYTPQGQLAATVGAGTSPLGMQNDYTAASGAVNMHARWYAPTLGVFLSRDNISLPLNQQNRYGYAGGHWPLTGDPTGHCFGPAIAICGWELAAAFGGTAGVGIGMGGYTPIKTTGGGLDLTAIPAYLAVGLVRGYAQIANGASTSSSTTSSTNISVSVSTAATQAYTAPALAAIGPSMAGLSQNLTNIAASINQSINALASSMAALEASMQQFSATMAALQVASANWSSFTPYTGEHPNSYINENVVPYTSGNAGSALLQCGGAGNTAGCATALAAESNCAPAGGSIATACAPAIPQLWQADRASHTSQSAAIATAATLSQSASLPPDGPEGDGPEQCLPDGAAQLPQDALISPRAPAPKGLIGRPIAKNAEQNEAVAQLALALRSAGALDIRINQHQVNFDGVRVGMNRPDLQYSLDGKRYYVEWDTKSSARGPGHRDRICVNDPDGVVRLITLGE